MVARGLFIMKFFILVALVGVGWLLDVREADAHARWKGGSAVSPPRDLSSGLKAPPCGGAPRTTNPKIYRPGQTLAVEFEETINHPGYFEIRVLGENDTPLAGVVSPLVTINDTQNTPIANGMNHQYKANITLPNIQCEKCALQLIQVMTENPDFPSRYYSCSDIRISEDANVEAKSGNKPPKPMNLRIQRSP
jgi:hypothetical protein